LDYVLKNTVDDGDPASADCVFRFPVVSGRIHPKRLELLFYF